MSAVEADQSLAQRIRQAGPGDEPFRVRLQTSGRVLRRVTDGIYREPWAAIRELIANAYDADATRVVITTDAPLFRRMSIRDDGNGFTSEALASMCENIGGSPKRTAVGAELGVTSREDPNMSPGGRRLIGKLGIGLFSVSQLTQQFRIITKVRGERTRTLADVILFRHAETKRTSNATSRDEEETTGEVQITKIAADDAKSHGTDVIIDCLLPGTRDEFRSRDLWELALHPPSEAEGGGSVQKPAYHIGFATGEGDGYTAQPVLPWREDDDPRQRFRHLAQAMFDRATGSSAERRPSLKGTFDNYLRFIWLVALSVPLDYMGKHPFDIKGDDGVRVFQLGPMKTGRAKEIELGTSETVRDRLGLRAPQRGGAKQFTVIIDGIELSRPIRFTDLPRTSNKLTTPLLFIGSQDPDTRKFDARKTGGPLGFEGYLLWSPRVVPIEHNGVLIRVGDASGALFDETFMRYQISEQTRKEQVSAEIFVHEGMDAALHIDRESFNHSHPHYQYLAAWLHDAFKQLATRQKAIGSEMRRDSRTASHASAEASLTKMVEGMVAALTGGEEEPIKVQFVDQVTPQDKQSPAAANLLTLPRTMLSQGNRIEKPDRCPTKPDASHAKLTAILQILHAAGMLDGLSAAKREKVLNDLAAIILFRGDE